MITNKIQSSNNTVSFRAIKPISISEKAQKFLKNASDFSSVHQRIAIGGTAFLFQPLVDLRNKEVDKDTRKVSAVRSAAKAVVGTATGIAIRGACMKIAELKYSTKGADGKIKIDINKIKKAFGENLNNLSLSEKELIAAAKRIPSVIGTLTALVVMIATNFAIDAPLTNMLSDFFEKTAKKYIDDNKTGGNKND